MKFSQHLKKQIELPEINNLEELHMYTIKKELKRSVRVIKQLQNMGVYGK